MMPGLVRLEAVHFAYPGRPPVLAGIDFAIRSGERWALTGANGAGKTTLFHLMVGLLLPTRGNIHAFGSDRRTERDFHEVRAKVGLLFQDSDDQLFCPTVAEDIAFGPLNLGRSRAEARAIVAATLDRVGLAGFGDRVTHKLSGGEKRLVALATVLAMEPRLLLLDEPSNGLDGDARQRLITVLTSLPQALMVISHDTDLLDRLTDRRVNLDGGRIMV
jgi:cobalt/nickel transport system ATP-binding protein